MEALDPRILLSGPGDHDDMLHPEHTAAMKLVPREEATHVASSGAWSAIWGGDRPGTGDQVLIPEGVTVTVDGRFADELEWVRVDGTLRFATDRDTALRVETIVVSPEGRLQIGTAEQPVGEDFSAQVTFVDQGPIDRAEDPLGVGRGLVDLSGHLSIHGAETTGFVDLASYPRKGDTVLRLAEVPTNWEVGGTVVVAGIRYSKDLANSQDETVRIVAIRGQEVAIDRPLLYDHVVDGNVPLPLAYLDRNVVLTSENTADPASRGHIMVMSGGHDHVHQPGDPEAGAIVAYARLDGLGRTRADMHVTDPKLDDHGNLISSTTGNDRGRYSLHFHRMGIDRPEKPSALVKGIAVTHGLKWGVVSHESHVVVEDSVTYDVHGAGFATEFGNEIGAFRDNLAIRGIGPGRYVQETHRQVGFEGNGFWMQGGGTEVTGNTAIGQTEAFVLFASPDLPGIEFPLANLPEDVRDELAFDTNGNSRTHVPVYQVPYRFTGNTTIGSTTGLATYNSLGDGDIDSYNVNSLIADSTFTDVEIGILQVHTSKSIIQDVRIFAGAIGSKGYTTYGTTRSITFNNIHIEGFRRGISLPNAGHNVINGGYFRNQVENIVLWNMPGFSVVLNLDDATFVAPKTTFRGYKVWDIYYSLGGYGNGDLPRLFQSSADSAVLNKGGQTYYLYPREAGRDYWLGSTDTRQGADVARHLPEEIRAMTAGELWDAHHVAPGGAIAPPDAVAIMPGLHGLASTTPPPPRSSLEFVGKFTTNQVENYTLRMKNDRGTVVDVATADLVPNQWNFIKAEYQGQTVTGVVYADNTPPEVKVVDTSGEFLENPTITRDEVMNGFSFTWLYTDYGARSQAVSRSQQVSAQEIVVDDDGKVRITRVFKDDAGNVTEAVFTFSVV